MQVARLHAPHDIRLHDEAVPEDAVIREPCPSPQREVREVAQG
jgi:hypothetical protein